MHKVLVNRLGQSKSKSVVRLTDRLDMTLDVYRGHKTTTHQQHKTVSSILNQENVNVILENEFTVL